MDPVYFQSSLILASSVSFFVGVLLLWFKSTNREAGNLLSFAFLLLSYPIFLTYLVSTGFIEVVPHLYRTGYVAMILFVPVSYLYVRSLFSQVKLSKKDLWHGLPALLYLLDFLPFFLLTGEEKMQALNSGEAGSTILMFAESRFLPAGGYLTLKYLIQGIYWMLQASILFRYVHNQKQQVLAKNRVLLIWVGVFLFCQLTVFMPPLPFLGEAFREYQYLVYLFMTGSLCTLSAVSLFLFPEILYGIQELPHRASLISKQSRPNVENAKDRYLSKAKIQELSDLVHDHFEQHQPYLKLQYSLSQMSGELGVPAQYLSAAINECDQVNFNDFLNRYRIQYCLEKLQEDRFSYQKIDWIAEQCGFNNRNTFTQAFKKVTGMSPSAYIKKVKAL
ncbi:helix-turn-helix domain-containing protein [Pararhodonellum marinum]|uniref:helix-turn-helix domain-containing protein n=1 Tax=Pararhodonellum marinum TaxID=2755358 RepID=UPI00188EE662|nr:helix-turn-helix domain-containing protein [Pararhodonellum marinum]